jgi:hypothetical protein
MSTVTLNTREALDLLMKYIELGQSKGVFKKLQDAYLFKRAFNVLQCKQDPEITVDAALSMLSQGITLIQGAGGVFTITDAADIFTILQFLDANKEDLYKVLSQEVELGNTLEQEKPQVPQEPQQEVPEDPEDSDAPFDLSQLSKPIPLKINEV